MSSESYNHEKDSRQVESIVELFHKVESLISEGQRYPLPIQATIRGEVVTAHLLDEQGRVRFDGASYGSPSRGRHSGQGWDRNELLEALEML